MIIDKRLEYIYLVLSNPSELSQEEKEELLVALESEIQRVEKETELLEMDGRIKQLQSNLMIATNKFEKLKDKSD